MFDCTPQKVAIIFSIPIRSLRSIEGEILSSIDLFYFMVVGIRQKLALAALNALYMSLCSVDSVMSLGYSFAIIDRTFS